MLRPVARYPRTLLLTGLWTGLWCLALTATVPPARAADEVRQPVADNLYAAYKTLYDYDAKQPLNVQTTRNEEQGGTKVEAFRFDSANGEKVPGVLLVPPSTKKRAVVLILHGYGQSKDIILPAAPMMAQFGIEYAFLALDAQYHGERKKDGVEFVSRDFAQSQKAFIQTVIDYRRALDFIATRPDLDASRVAVAGFSLGSMLGTVLTALEPDRIKTALLAVGGADWITLFQESQHEALMKLRNGEPKPDWAALRKFTDPVDPLNFAPHLGDRPILLINANDDQVIPRKAAQRLHDVATGKPLVKEWVDGGHELPPDVVLPRVLGWLQEHL